MTDLFQHDVVILTRSVGKLNSLDHSGKIAQIWHLLLQSGGWCPSNIVVVVEKNVGYLHTHRSSSVFHSFK
eukprot:jgi/Botrbrau1/2757/Bobra.0164s0036.1